MHSKRSIFRNKISYLKIMYQCFLHNKYNNRIIMYIVLFMWNNCQPRCVYVDKRLHVSWQLLAIALQAMGLFLLVWQLLAMVLQAKGIIPPCMATPCHGTTGLGDYSSLYSNSLPWHYRPRGLFLLAWQLLAMALQA